MPVNGVVDVHGHMVPPELFERVRSGVVPGVSVAGKDGAEVLVAGADRLGPFSKDMTDLATRLQWMDDHGIAEQWVSPWLDLFTWHAFSGEEGRLWSAAVNSSLRDITERSGGRLSAVPVPRLRADPGAEGFLGGIEGTPTAVLVNTQPRDVGSLADPSLLGFWAYLAETGVPAVLHPPVNGPSCAFTAPILQNVSGRVVDTSAAVLDMMVSGLFERLPDLRVLVVHGGGFLPYQAHRLDGLARAGLLEKTAMTEAPSRALRRLHFDTVALDALSIELLVRRVGADRVLLGSDAPFPIGDHDPVATLHSTGLDDDAKQAICCANARALRSNLSGGGG